MLVCNFYYDIKRVVLISFWLKTVLLFCGWERIVLNILCPQRLGVGIETMCSLKSVVWTILWPENSSIMWALKRVFNGRQSRVSCGPFCSFLCFFCWCAILLFCPVIRQNSAIQDITCYVYKKALTHILQAWLLHYFLHLSGGHLKVDMHESLRQQPHEYFDRREAV